MEEIRERIEKLIVKIQKIGKEIASFHGNIRIITHYDCDGITSGAIIIKALASEGKNFRLSFVKQLNENIIDDLAEEKNRMILILDCGSGKLESIQEKLCKKEIRVIICDHHQPQGEVYSKNLFHINTCDFGIDGNISAAGISYLLARALNPSYIELSELAIIGAIGDAQVGAVGADWGLFGLNKEILKDSQEAGKIKVEKGLRLWGRYTRPLHKALEYSVDPFIPGVTGSESASIQFLKETGIEPKKSGKWRTLSDLSQEEQKKLASGIIIERIKGDEKNPDWIFGDNYELMDKRDFRDAHEFATMLNATGKIGKAYIGIGLCLNDKEYFARIKKIQEDYRKEIGRGISWINKNTGKVKTTDNGNYILAGNNISEHVISNVVSIVNRSGTLPDKPTFAFVDTDDGMVKISARVSDNLAKGMDLSFVVAKAKEIGGEGGGHKGAAGATIPKGEEENFIKLVEKTLKTPEKKQEYKESREKEQKSLGKENLLDSVENAVVTSGKEARRESAKKVERKGLVRYFNP